MGHTSRAERFSSRCCGSHCIVVSPNNVVLSIVDIETHQKSYMYVE